MKAGVEPMNFEFATATRIIFGPGVLEQVGPLAAGLGRRALVVTGQSTERVRPLLDILAAADVDTAVFSVAGEPTIAVVQHGTQRARDEKCQIVIC